MSSRTGLGAFEVGALEGVDELGGRPDRPHRKSASVVQHLYETRGIGPRYGYDVLCWLAAPWLVQLPLIDPHGNFGSPDDAPANPRYTELRLSAAGEMALASERGEIPRLPIALINGDLSIGGTSPPFSPAAVASAVQRAADRAVSDAELAALIGIPSFPTKCSVAGDVDELLAGGAGVLQLSASVVVEPDGDSSQLVISDLPLGVGADAVGEALSKRVNAERLQAERHPHLSARVGIPLRAIADMSAGKETRIVCTARTGADPEECRERILETWPVTIKVPVRLPAPIATIVRSRVDDDPPAQAAALEALIA